MKKVALSEVKDDLSKFLRLAEKEEVVITRHGKPAGGLIGFESEDDWIRAYARIRRGDKWLVSGFLFVIKNGKVVNIVYAEANNGPSGNCGGL